MWQPDTAQVTAECSQPAAVICAQAAQHLSPPVLCTASLQLASTIASSLAQQDPNMPVLRQRLMPGGVAGRRHPGHSAVPHV